MNPFDYLDTLDEAKLKKIQEDSKEQYTKEEVLELLAEVKLDYRKAIYHGEYVMDLEDVNKEIVTVNDREFAIQKLVTEEGKYLLFMQLLNVDKDFTTSDLDILASEVDKAVKKVSNIIGVVLLPTNMEISLVTGKLDTIPYAKELGIDDDFVDPAKFIATAASKYHPIGDISTLTNVPRRRFSITTAPSTSTFNSVYINYYK